MKLILLTCLLLCLTFTLSAQQMAPSREVKIKMALLAAPVEKRDSASVYEYTDKNGMTLLKAGTNELYCLADDPSRPGISVACYHKDLQPFMIRGDELRRQGRDARQVFDEREAEVKSGKLRMPKAPATLFVYSGKDENYDPATGVLKDGYLRYVVYIPYATAQSTGLPLRAGAPGMPWIMHPGTHGAHIMINPPMPQQAAK
ncbi:MAG: hypothetical protein EOP49_37310 [Sphingobacteriales bacterium]|nr:MAG: hypothetical protein EOP49_37310 [Sphingobacteriales bacterium]